MTHLSVICNDLRVWLETGGDHNVTMVPKGRWPRLSAEPTAFEVWNLQFSMPPSSAEGYARTDLTPIDTTRERGPHYDFRNEWWLLTKESPVGQAPRVLEFWRHTFLPPSRWKTDLPEELYSVWRIREDSRVQYFWGHEVHWVDTPFRCTWPGGGRFASAEKARFWPLQWRTSLIPGQTANERADPTRIETFVQERPTVRGTRSHACLACFGGTGVKRYAVTRVIGTCGQTATQTKGEDTTHRPVSEKGNTTPELKGPPPDLKGLGFWLHAWDAHLVPTGFASSWSLRMLDALRGKMPVGTWSFALWQRSDGSDWIEEFPSSKRWHLDNEGHVGRDWKASDKSESGKSASLFNPKLWTKAQHLGSISLTAHPKGGSVWWFKPEINQDLLDSSVNTKLTTNEPHFSSRVSKTKTHSQNQLYPAHKSSWSTLERALAITVVVCLGLLWLLCLIAMALIFISRRKHSRLYHLSVVDASASEAFTALR